MTRKQGLGWGLRDVARNERKRERDRRAPYVLAEIRKALRAIETWADEQEAMMEVPGSPEASGAYGQAEGARHAVAQIRKTLRKKF